MRQILLILISVLVVTLSVDAQRKVTIFKLAGQDTLVYEVTYRDNYTFDPVDSTYEYSGSTVISSTENIQQAWPVNSIFISTSSTNPSASLGYGTWVSFGAGRVLVGRDAGQSEFDVVEETGGAKTHTLTIAEMPAHTHQLLSGTTDGAGSNIADMSLSNNNLITSGSTGGGGAHNNLQPYIVVYMWKRTS